MTYPVLANLEGFSVRKKPTFATAIFQAVNGRELSFGQQAFPVWEFELEFHSLPSETENQVLNTDYQHRARLAYEQILLVFLMSQGQGGRFYYQDPSDCTRTNQGIGVGNGTDTTFPIIRDWGTGTKLIEEPVGRALSSGLVVRVNGTPTTGFTLASDGRSLVFDNAVPNGDVIQADFTFQYLCRFLEDVPDFDEFFKDWHMTILKFRTVNLGFRGAQGPPAPPPGPHWRIYELNMPAAHTFAYLQNFVNGRVVSRNGIYAVGIGYDSTGVRANGIFWDTRNLAGYNTQAPINASLHTAVVWGVTAADDDGANWTGWFLDPDTNSITPCVWASQIPNPMQGSDITTSDAINMSISDDGSIGTGFVELAANANQPRAAWWTNALDATYNLLPQITPNQPSSASGIADDNDTICGLDTSGGVQRAVKWSIGGATETLLDIVAGDTQSSAEAISADGTTIVGSRVDAGGARHACYWVGTTLTSLPFIDGSDGLVAEAHGISFDNLSICGQCTDGNDRYIPVIWQSGVPVQLPLFSDSTATDDALVYGISDDGLTAVGQCMRMGFVNPVVWKYF